jgi:hypothetical protein
MKLDALTTKLAPVKVFVVRYSVVLFIVSIVGIFVYMTLSIARYANLEPTSQQVDEKKASMTVVKLDEKSITKIKQLQDQNISIEVLFNNGRENPFQ